MRIADLGGTIFRNSVIILDFFGRNGGRDRASASQLGGIMPYYITFASIQAVRIHEDGQNGEILVGPHSSSEIFLDLRSFKSSILFGDNFFNKSQPRNAQKGTDSWLLLLEKTEQNNDNHKK